MLHNVLSTCVTLTLLVTLSGASIASESISLEDAINTSLVNNPNLKQLQFGTDSADLSIDTARSEFEVSARPESGVALDDDGGTTGFYGLRVSKKTLYGGELSVGGVNNSLFDSNGGSHYSVTFSQSLFRRAGTLINEENIVQAKQSHLTASRALELSRSRTVVSVVEAYQQVLRLEQQLAADRQALQRSDSLYKLTLAKERLGRTTRIDTLRVQLQHGETVSRASNSKEQLSSAKRVLGELMGLQNRILPELMASPLFEVDYGSLEVATSTALSNRLEYAQVQQQHEDALRGTRIAKRSLKPRVKLVARYDHADSDLFFNDDFNTSGNTWSINLVSDTDFNQNQEKLEYKQSLLRQGRTLEDIRAQYLAIGREVELALLAYQRAHQQLTVLEGNYQHAEARLKLARRLFRVGRTDGFSVTDAEQSYFTAQSLWFSGRSEASVNGYRLLHATGTLLEAPLHLKPKTS